MFAWISKASAPAGVGAPTPLLGHLAGEFAAQIAGLWPAPHAVFLTATAERRHLVFLALAAGTEPTLELADGLLHWPLRRAIKVALPDAPDGLARALAILGELAWPGEDYRRLLRLLGQPEAAKRLRHAPAVSPGLVAALERTPEPLLRAGISRLELSAESMEAVAEAWGIIAERDAPERLTAVAARWATAKDAERLRAVIDEDLTPPLPACPFRATDKLRPLATAEAMREAARRFNNCLASQVSSAADGSSVFFEWLPSPGAIVEVRRDYLRGWTLAQARLHENEDVAEPDRAAIRAALAEMGVHTGRAGWALERALNMGLLWKQTPYSIASDAEDVFID